MEIYIGSFSILFKEEKKHDDGALGPARSRILASVHAQELVRWNNQYDDLKSLKNNLGYNEEMNRLKFADMEEMLYGKKYKNENVITEIKQNLIRRPQIMETKLKNIENEILSNKQITEDKLKNDKVLVDHDKMNSENSLKVLKENMQNNPFIRVVMLNDLNNIFLGNEINTEYLLNKLNKNIRRNPAVGLSILKFLEKILFANKLIEESKVKKLRKILLTNKQLTANQLHEIKLLIVDILCDYSRLKGIVQPHGVDVLNKTDIVKENDLSQKKDSIRKNDISSKINVPRKDFISKTDLGKKKELLQKINSHQKNDIIKKNYKPHKDDIIRKIDLKKKKEFLHKDFPLKKRDTVEKKNIEDEVDSLKKKDGISDEELLKKRDSLSDTAKEKLSQKGKQKLVVHVHMSDKKKKLSSKKKKKLVLDAFFKDKTKKSELIGKKDSIEKGALTEEKELPKGNQFIIDIDMDDKKNKEKELLKDKTWIVHTFMKKKPKEVDLLQEVDTEHKIDVTARDAVYEAIEEALFDSIIEPVPKKKKSKVIRVLKKLGAYGTPVAAAVTSIPFLVIEAIKVSSLSAVSEATTAGVVAATSSIGMCAAETVAEALPVISGFFTSWSSGSSLLGSLFSGAIDVAKATVSMASCTLSNAPANTLNAATAVGTSVAFSQIIYPILIGVAVSIIIFVIYRIIVSLDKKGKLEFLNKYKREFMRFLKKLRSDKVQE
ncbi:Plasmodium exported protein, unknown function [Plasmodium ovale curtisi]|uniref:Uncharacterized protein n=1 Tax=Plasmodium ovale curtisi TaxID=864141 RepID=A0A1A8XAJ9_PLAOA|nr:Plasmodium exported protein, unknown function [Plasmodium ovale curtisi]